jgi:hypothetical protein
VKLVRCGWRMIEVSYVTSHLFNEFNISGMKRRFSSGYDVDTFYFITHLIAFISTSHLSRLFAINMFAFHKHENVLLNFAGFAQNNGAKCYLSRLCSNCISEHLF